MAPGEHRTATEPDAAFAAGREGHERAGFHVEAVEDRRVGAEQETDAVDDPLADEIQVERRGGSRPRSASALIR